MTRLGTLPKAGLSLDLDNLWSYRRSQGDTEWQDYSSFLQLVIPRILTTLDELELSATIFVVGRDAANPAHRPLLQALADAGHELGNHSYDHAPNFQNLNLDQLVADFELSENAIGEFSSTSCAGFRAPSFGLSATVLEVLVARGYRYDSSLWPTSVGPLARLWERINFARPKSGETSSSYGSFRMARAPQTLFHWQCAAGDITELPVTTMPYLRVPVHWTYLNFLADKSPFVAMRYLAAHLSLAKRTQLAPQLLLHTTDFLGCDDASAPTFMPGMRRTAAEKNNFIKATLRCYQRSYSLTRLDRFAADQTEFGINSGISPSALLS